MDSGRVLHASRDDIHVLRYIGDIRYTLSPCIERFTEGVFAAGRPQGFVIDLTEADRVDSTNLGLLVRLAKRMQSGGAGGVTLVSNRAEINSVLTSMALDEVFDIVEDSGVQTEAEQEVPSVESDQASLHRTLIDAHRALMDVSERNRGLFRDLVDCLEKEGASH